MTEIAVIFKLQIQQQSRMRVHRAKSSAKAVSSYLLSGINIKKMIADEADLSHNIPNISDATIVKISKRPIFKIIKEKDEEDTELPSKTFKIRSFTRKLRKNEDTHPPDNHHPDNHEMFEKVHKLRHLKSVNNRIELFNLSAISKFSRKDNDQKAHNSDQQYTKMRQLLVNNTEKWRTSSQIIIKERLHPHHPHHPQPPFPCDNVSFPHSNVPFVHSNLAFAYKRVPFQYSHLDTERYRELASKITIKMNQEQEFIKMNQGQDCIKLNQGQEKGSVLLIISVEALQVAQRRVVKSSKTMHEQQGRQRQRAKFGLEVFEAIKLFTSRESPFALPNQGVKIAFKVNSGQQAEELREKLQWHQIQDYFCIFHPTRKFSQIFNLYQLEPLLPGITHLILVEHKSKLTHQFPVTPPLPALLFANYNETYLTLAKLSNAIRTFLCPKLQQREQGEQGEQLQDCRLDKSLIFVNPNQPTEYEVKCEDIQLANSQLEARLKFTLDSRAIRNQLLPKHPKEAKPIRQDPKTISRSALEDKTYSINNISQSITLENHKTHKNQKQPVLLQFNSQELQGKFQERLQERFQERVAGELLSRPQNGHHKPALGKTNTNSRSDQIDEITSALIQRGLKSRGVGQELSELARRNEHILKQISQYLCRVGELQCSGMAGIFGLGHEKGQTRGEGSPVPQGQGIAKTIKCYKML